MTQSALWKRRQQFEAFSPLYYFVFSMRKQFTLPGIAQACKHSAASDSIRICVRRKWRKVPIESGRAQTNDSWLDRFSLFFATPQNRALRCPLNAFFYLNRYYRSVDGYESHCLKTRFQIKSIGLSPFLHKKDCDAFYPSRNRIAVDTFTQRFLFQSRKLLWTKITWAELNTISVPEVKMAVKTTTSTVNTC